MSPDPVRVDAPGTDPAATRPSRRPLDGEQTSRASRTWWDRDAADYQAEHAGQLGIADFVWSPEALHEHDAGLLGDVTGLRVLEIGCGAAQCARWLSDRVGPSGSVFGIDISEQQLRISAGFDTQAHTRVPVATADAERLPLADASFDLAFSAFGAFPFVADARAALTEAYRVLRPGGRLVFAVSHPLRWAMADDPEDLTLTGSYFDRTPYVELDVDGTPCYVEHHRTIGDWVSAITGAGLVVGSCLEPEWPEGYATTWGGWGPVRGDRIPGTLIWSTHRPDRS